ncbi:MAG TPA: hypothetical protein VK745_02725 [Polyangiaceae bacterium]|jgi:hypothetical protein|nr:hypothetical protein [Polyangiaceae bacterium]
MRTSTRTWTTIVAASIAALSLTGSALAQSHRDDPRDEHRADPHAPAAPAEPRDEHRADPHAPAAPAGEAADPKIAERVHQLEEQRQRDRKTAIKDVKTWNDGRTQRALQHRNEIASTWGNIVTNPEAQAELKTHADRMARLNRILDIANEKADNALASRCQGDIQLEVDRDARILQSIRARGGVR